MTMPIGLGLLLTMPSVKKRVDNGPVEVTLITYANNKFVINIPHLVTDFTYAGKLWSYNNQFSEASKSHIYVEITDAVCKEVRHNAGLFMQIAGKWEAQLEALKEENKQ